MRRSASALSATVIAAGALALGPATAAEAVTTTFGSTCQASRLTPDTTVVLTRSASLPAAAPVAGVMTKVAFNLPTTGEDPSATVPTKIKLVQPEGGTAYKIVAESARLLVPLGPSSYGVRLPVTAGQLIGLSGETFGAVSCDGADPANAIVYAAGDQAVGTTQSYTESPGYALPLVATIEPDADKDGYGDETQDKCPQSAALQTACPVVKLGTKASSAQGRIKVKVTTDNAAKVKVSGIAKIGGKKIKLKAGTKTVAPGKGATFKVKLPRALKAALADLPAGKSITVRITASATDTIGRVTTDKAKVKLPGTGD